MTGHRRARAVSASAHISTGDHAITSFCSGAHGQSATPLPSASYAFVRLLPSGAVPVYRATIGGAGMLEKLVGTQWTQVQTELHLSPLSRYAVAWIQQSAWDGNTAALQSALGESYAITPSVHDLQEGRLVIPSRLGAHAAPGADSSRSAGGGSVNDGGGANGTAGSSADADTSAVRTWLERLTATFQRFRPVGAPGTPLSGSILDLPSAIPLDHDFLSVLQPRLQGLTGDLDALDQKVQAFASNRTASTRHDAAAPFKTLLNRVGGFLQQRDDRIGQDGTALANATEGLLNDCAPLPAELSAQQERERAATPEAGSRENADGESAEGEHEDSVHEAVENIHELLEQIHDRIESIVNWSHRVGWVSGHGEIGEGVAQFTEHLHQIDEHVERLTDVALAAQILDSLRPSQQQHTEDLLTRAANTGAQADRDAAIRDLAGKFTIMCNAFSAVAGRIPAPLGTTIQSLVDRAKDTFSPEWFIHMTHLLYDHVDNTLRRQNAADGAHDPEVDAILPPEGS